MREVVFVRAPLSRPTPFPPRIAKKHSLERRCEAVAADPASLHYAVTRRAKTGLSRHSLGRRRNEANRRSTAGGRAEKIQRGRRKSSSKPRVSHIPQGLANAGAVISRKIPAILRASGNWQRGESGGGKAGTAVPLRQGCLYTRTMLFIVIKCPPVIRHTAKHKITPTIQYNFQPYSISSK